MENIISYFYNFDIIDRSKYHNETIYKTNNSNYVFKEINDVNKVYYINNLISKVESHMFFSYNLIPNIYSDIITKYDDKNYVLIDVKNDYFHQVDFVDMISFYNKSTILLKNIDYNNNWENTWENKINYLTDYFLNSFKTYKDNSLIFYFYISVAENALLYVKKLRSKYMLFNKICFTHRRMTYPNTKLDFYNPLNFVIDLEVRDIGEYIKSLYYSNEDYTVDLEYFLKTHKINQYLASMLFARVVFPSIFFDDFENNSIDLNKYIDFERYIDFIKKVYDVITSYTLIDKLY